MLGFTAVLAIKLWLYAGNRSLSAEQGSTHVWSTQIAHLSRTEVEACRDGFARLGGSTGHCQHQGEHQGKEERPHHGFDRHQCNAQSLTTRVAIERERMNRKPAKPPTRARGIIAIFSMLVALAKKPERSAVDYEVKIAIT